jgi:DNA polymerase-3 subunit alpha
VRNVGKSAIGRILEVRGADGPFESLYDFITRIDLRTVNRRVLESLAQAGAFDAFARHRAEAFDAIELLLEVGNRVREERERGQTLLFASPENEGVLNPFRDGLPQADEWPRSQMLHLEKEVLGFYYSGHPLEKWGTEVRSFATTTAAELAECRDGADVVVGAMVTTVRGAFDRRGNRMAFLELEDFTGTMEAIVFSEPLKRYADCLTPDAMVLVGGAVSIKDEGEPKLLLDRAIPLDTVGERIADRIYLDVLDRDVDDDFVAELKRIGERRLGGLRTVLRIGLRDGNLVRVEVPDIRLPASPEAVAELEELAGEGSVRLGGSWSPDRPDDNRRRFARKAAATA